MLVTYAQARKGYALLYLAAIGADDYGQTIKVYHQFQLFYVLCNYGVGTTRHAILDTALMKLLASVGASVP